MNMISIIEEKYKSQNGKRLGPESNRVCVWKWRHVKTQANQQLTHGPVHGAETTKRMQARLMKIKQILEKRNSSIHRVHNHPSSQEQMCIENHETHIIGFAIQHTSSIQHLFNLILTISHGSSTNKFQSTNFKSW